MDAGYDSEAFRAMSREDKIATYRSLLEAPPSMDLAGITGLSDGELETRAANAAARRDRAKAIVEDLKAARREAHGH